MIAAVREFGLSDVFSGVLVSDLLSAVVFCDVVSDLVAVSCDLVNLSPQRLEWCFCLHDLQRNFDVHCATLSQAVETIFPSSQSPNVVGNQLHSHTCKEMWPLTEQAGILPALWVLSISISVECSGHWGCMAFIRGVIQEKWHRLQNSYLLKYCILEFCNGPFRIAMFTGEVSANVNWQFSKYGSDKRSSIGVFGFAQYC